MAQVCVYMNLISAILDYCLGGAVAQALLCCWFDFHWELIICDVVKRRSVALSSASQHALPRKIPWKVVNGVS